VPPPPTEPGPPLTLDERFLLAVALKNGLITRRRADQGIARRAALSADGRAPALDQVLVLEGLLSGAAIDRIRRAQAATHAMRLDMLYAEAARRLGVVDESTLARLLDERRRSPRLDRIGDALVDQGAIDPEDHARVLKELRRGVVASEAEYVAELRERVGTSPLAKPARAESATWRSAPRASTEESGRREATAKRSKDAPRDSGRLRSKAPSVEARPPPVVEEPEDDDGEGWLGEAPTEEVAARAREERPPSEEELYESAVQALPKVAGRRRRKELRDRDIRDLDDSISRAEARAARTPPKKSPQAAAALVVLIGVGALVAALTSGDGSDDARATPPAEERAVASARGSERAGRPRASQADRDPAPIADPASAASELSPLDPGGRPQVAGPSSLDGPPLAAGEPPGGASGAAAPPPALPGGASGGPDAARFQRAFHEAQKAEAQGRLDEALSLYVEALSAADPDSARATLVRQRLEAGARAREKANASRASAGAPREKPEELWRRAVTALKEGRGGDAVSPLETLSNEHGDERALRAAAFARDVAEMAYVPGGPCTLGTDDADLAHARPAHAVITTAFFVEKRETTNAAYMTFVIQTGGESPLHWVAPGRAPVPGDEPLPVVNVSYNEAVRYADWASRRLPTEEEWERAARGSDGRRFPWGAAESGVRAHIGPGAAGAAGPRAAGSSPGDLSAHGCLDMGGNVAEWTSSPFRAYPGGDPAAADFSDAFRVVKGGSWRYDMGYARCAWRDRARPEERFPEVGFRLVRDVPAWFPELR